MLRYGGFQPYERASELGFGSDSTPIFSTPKDSAAFEEWYVQQQKTKVQAQQDAEAAQSREDSQALATTPKLPYFGSNFGEASSAKQPPAPWRSNASGRPVAPVASAWGGPPPSIMLAVMEAQKRSKDPRYSSALARTNPAMQSSVFKAAFEWRR